MYHLRTSFITLISILFSVQLNAQTIRLQYTEIDNWVTITEVPEQFESTDEPYDYLLIDNQLNSTSKKEFYKYAYQINNSEGVQSMSSIEISYNPSFQVVALHEISIFRDDAKIEVSPKFIEIQRETSLEQSLYDGYKTIVNNIEDVRPGDVLVYSFTIQGRNPILGDHIYCSFYQEYGISVKHIHQSLITDQIVDITASNGSPDYVVSDLPPYGKKYTWDLTDQEPRFIGDQAPRWYNPYKRVEISNYKNWEEVVEWAKPLYAVSDHIRDQITKDISGQIDLTAKEENILDAIEFVQDDIRYLGFEYGVNSFKPYSPEKVLNQRFGDCKDKSLLLVTILDIMGVEANPVLVHTGIGAQLKDYLPSSQNFDHCIVQLEFDKSTYYVDPTISQQRGGLLKRFIPDYGYVLPIHTGSEGLVFIEDDIIPLVQVEEELTLDSVGGGAHINITTKSYDSEADSKRSSFMSQGLSSIKEGYQDFYSNLYPNIKVEKVDFIDSTDQSFNFFTVEEVYRAPEAWSEDEPDLGQVFDYQALELQGMLDKSSNYEADEPYSLGNRIEFIQTTTINLPETWSIIDDQVNISNDYFDYSYSLLFDRETRQRFQMKHRYYLKKEFIEPADIPDVLKDYRKAYENTGYQLTYGSDEVTGSNSLLSWLFLIMSLVVGLGLGYYMAKFLYLYDPSSSHSFSDKDIGGWMILPLIGLFLSPLLIISENYTSFVEEGIGLNALEVLWTSDSIENSKFIVFSVLMEWVMSTLLIVYAIMTIYLFFRKRTSLPIVIIGFFILSIASSVYNLVIAYTIGEGISPEDNADVIKQVVVAALWSAYFTKSERVEKTFTRRLNQPTTPISQDSILE